MSKAKVEKAVEQWNRWMPDYNWDQRVELMEIVGRLLSSLSGGDRFEDMGYEPYDAINWRELEMVVSVLSAVHDKRDVEYTAELLFEDDEDEDEDEED